MARKHTENEAEGESAERKPCPNCGKPVARIRLPNGLVQKFCPLPAGSCRKAWRRKYLQEVYRLGVEAIKKIGGWDGE